MNRFFSTATLALVGTTIADDLVQDKSKCVINGDPHFYPFNSSKSYINQQTGCLHYVYGQDGNLAIQGHQKECPHNSHLACVDSVAVQFCGTRFEINSNDKHWTQIIDHDEEFASLPQDDFLVQSTKQHTGSILTLPDKSQVQVVFGYLYQNVIIHLPHEYDNKVRGMCGTKSDAPNLLSNDIVGTGHYVNEDNTNIVTEEMDIVSSGNKLPEVPGFISTAENALPNICTFLPTEATNTTQNIFPTTESNYTGPGTVETLPAEVHTAEENEEARCTCQEVADTELARFSDCVIPSLNDTQNGAVAACKVDTLSLDGGREAAEENLRMMIQANCADQFCSLAVETEMSKHDSCSIDSIDSNAMENCKATTVSGQYNTSALVTFIKDKCDEQIQPAADEHNGLGCHLHESN